MSNDGTNIRDLYDDEDIVPEITNNRLPPIVSGYDPLFIAFYDNSIHRSFKTNNWYWDFGDYVYYGYSQCEWNDKNVPFTDRHCIDDEQSSRYENVKILDMFELKGDDSIVEAMSKYGEMYAAYKDFVENHQLGTTNYGLMVPLQGWQNSYPTDLTWTKHYTGIWIRSIDGDTVSGDSYEKEIHIDHGCLYNLTCINSQGQILECPKNNLVREIGTMDVPAKISEIRPVQDSCGNGEGRTLCSDNGANLMNNTVYHVYKGAGVYPVSMKTFLTWPNIENTLTTTVGRKILSADGAKIDEADPENVPNVYAQDALVIVAPACPCISGMAVTNDESSIGITADDFSCASAGCFGIDYWEQVIGILGGFTVMDEDTGKDRYITTGYGPYVRVTVSGSVQPRSMPVTAFDWFWDDWFIDQDCVGDYYWLGDVVGGWSTNWATMYPREYTPIHDSILNCHVYEGVRNFFGKHTFTMPGCYRISCQPRVDFSRLPSILWDFLSLEAYEVACQEVIDLGEKIMVREVKPKFADPNDAIRVEKTQIDGNTVDVNVDVFERLVPGSYPIGRIDWDFHDGTNIASIYRYDYMVDSDTPPEPYQKYYDDMFEPSITSGEAVPRQIEHDGESVPYRCLDLNYFVGNGVGNESITTKYKETRPETWRMYHRYIKHEIDDGTRTISVTAYAENTMSPCSGEVVIDIFPVYADPVAGEGIARVVDTRLHDDTTLIVFEGDKTKQLYTTKL